jgi:hypothetical protein
MAPLTFLLFLWNGTKPYPFYNEARIAAIAQQIRDHVRVPHRIVLLSELPFENIPQVDEIRPCPKSVSYHNLALNSPVDCTRRLRMFDPEYSKQFGTPWVASIDIDTLILNDITDIVETAMNQPDGFAIVRGRWTNQEKTLRPYNGAFWFLRVGAQEQVWRQWDPHASFKRMLDSGWLGSDQVWLSLTVKDAYTFGPEHGVYYLGQYEKMQPGDPEPRIINWAGICKPWSKMAAKRVPELYDYYCDYDPQAPRRIAQAEREAG